MRLRSLLKTKDGKVLLQNFLSMSSLQLVTMLLPLITLPYVLRTIGYEKFGLIALSASLIAYFQSIVDYGFRVTAVRDIATHRNSPHKINLIYSRVMTAKMVFLVLALSVIALIVALYPPFLKEKELFLYTALSLVGFALFPEWFFQGMEKMRYITLINVTIKIAFAAAVFVCIKEQDDYILYPLLTSAGVFVAGIFSQIFLYKKFDVKFYILPFIRIKKTIRKNLPMFINQFMPNLYNNSTSFFLGMLTGAEMLGIYSAIMKVIDLCVVLLNIVSSVFFPFLNRRKNAFVMYRNIMLSLVAVGLVILFALRDAIFWYLDLSDPVALPVLVLTALSIVGFVAYDIYGLNYFIVNRQEKLVMQNTVVCSLIGFLMAAPLISFYGVIGAASTLLLGRLLMGGGLFYRYMRVAHA